MREKKQEVMEERKDHYETCNCDDCIFQGRSCVMFRKEEERCENFVSYTSRDRIKSDMKNKLFEQCLDNVNPEIRNEVRKNMDKLVREEEIYNAEFASNPYFMSTDGAQVVGAHQLGFKHGVEYADAHPSDETIMRILNCIGYEEKSWIEFVRKELERRKQL